MQQFLKWTLDAIRGDEAIMSWLEERRYEWVPLAATAIEKILEGQSVVIVTDREREWFCHYVIASVNKPIKNRPILPFFALRDLYPYLDGIKKDEEIDLLFDMLSLSFKGEYFFWYIGKSDDPRSQIAKRRDDSFLWLMDEEYQNSFLLKSYDNLLDMKLFQLFRLFDKSVDAALFGEIGLKA